MLLPERASTLRRRSARTQLAGLREALSDRPQLLVIDLSAAIPPSDATILSTRSALEGRKVEAERGAAPLPTLVLLGDAETAARILPAVSQVVHADSAPATAATNTHSDDAHALASATLTEGTAR